MQKEVLLSHKLQDHAYESQIPFGLKEDNLSQRNYQNQFSHPSLFHIELECQESFFFYQKDIHMFTNNIYNIKTIKIKVACKT